MVFLFYLSQNIHTLAEGRLFGRISSVFVHPMAFGLFLGLSLMYVYSVKDKIGKPLFYFLMLIIIVTIMVCGIRTPIAALLISVVSFLILKHQVKLMIQIVGLCLIGYLILLNIPGMESYIGSIFMQNSKSSNLAGSSLAMRIDQLGGGVFKKLEIVYYLAKDILGLPIIYCIKKQYIQYF
jgi:hypothetical protein